MSAPAAKPPVTCHVLDTVVGRPAAGIQCTLLRLSDPPPAIESASTHLAVGRTNSDGRVTAWETSDGSPLKLEENVAYKMRFETWDYWKGDTFFPFVEIMFVVKSTTQHYHIPLLLAPWSYSTYRGS